MIVSYFFLYKLYKVVHDFQGNLEQFVDFFLSDEGLFFEIMKWVEIMIILISISFYSYCVYIWICICSFLFSVFSSRAGRMVETSSSKFTLFVLRGPKKGTRSRLKHCRTVTQVDDCYQANSIESLSVLFFSHTKKKINEGSAQ